MGYGWQWCQTSSKIYWLLTLWSLITPPLNPSASEKASLQWKSTKWYFLFFVWRWLKRLEKHPWRLRSGGVAPLPLYLFPRSPTSSRTRVQPQWRMSTFQTWVQSTSTGRCWPWLGQKQKQMKKFFQSNELFMGCSKCKMSYHLQNKFIEKNLC